MTAVISLRIQSQNSECVPVCSTMYICAHLSFISSSSPEWALWVVNITLESMDMSLVL